ncbi:MAG: F-box protein [Verrucomicrobia bacterium]|nr:F-box protein [Verrucomicrobiota bacterium]MBS0636255.1 F-box protein [Verrucomicrobiota bacterium]
MVFGVNNALQFGVQYDAIMSRCPFSANNNVLVELDELERKLFQLDLSDDRKQTLAVEINRIAKTVFVPAEVLLRILSHLDAPEMAKLSATCRYYHEAITACPEFSVKALFLKRIVKEAKETLERELERCKAIEDPKERDWELYLVVRKISLFDPERAYQLIGLISEPFYRDNILAYVLIIRGEKDPEEALLLAETKVDQLSDKIDIQDNVLKSLAKKKMDKAFALAKQICNEAERGGTLSTLLHYAVESAPAHAGEIFRYMINYCSEVCCCSARHTVAQMDFSLAIQGVRRRDEYRSILFTYAYKHPEDVSRFFNDPNLNQVEVASLRILHAQELEKTDRVKAANVREYVLRIIHSLTDEYDKKSLLGKLAASAVLTDSNFAIKLLNIMHPGDECLFRMSGLVESHDPTLALSFLDQCRRSYYRELGLITLLPNLMRIGYAEIAAVIKSIKGIDGIEWLDPHLQDTMLGEYAAHLAKSDLAVFALQVREQIKHPPRKVTASVKIALGIESKNPSKAKRLIADALDAICHLSINEKIESDMAIARLLQEGLSVIRIHPPYRSFALKGHCKNK